MKQTSVITLCLTVSVILSGANVLGQCGDTWQPEVPHRVDILLDCGNDVKSSGTHPFMRLKYWKIFWTDGNVRRNAAAVGDGECYDPFFGPRRFCYPVHEIAPEWTVNNATTGTFEHIAYGGKYNSDKVCIVGGSVRLNTHTHFCSSEEEGNSGGGGCSDAAEFACYAISWKAVWDEASCTCHPGGLGGGCNELTGLGCDNGETPILIDVAGNKFKLTNAANGVLFDLNGDGSKDQFAWTSANSDDAWLVLDRNRNGTIDNGLELFGNNTEQPPSIPEKDRNGFHALAIFDNPTNGGNGDGKIDIQDAVFADLRLWQDLNHNGLSEPNEIKPLDHFDVVAIELDFKTARKRDKNGNLFGYRAKVWGSKKGKDKSKGKLGRWAWDVILQKAN